MSKKPKQRCPKHDAKLMAKNKPKDAVWLDNQTAGNLIKYLKFFPADAKVVIYDDARTAPLEYQNYDCVICDNFQQQKKDNTVQLYAGWRIDDAKEDNSKKRKLCQ